MNSADIKALIKRRYSFRPGSVVIEELRISCGFDGEAARSIDIWGIEANASKGCTATAYEIKVSRGDFLRDIRNPFKQRGARLFSDKFYFVAPEGMINVREIPDWAGLIDAKPEGLRTVVSAPFRSKDAPSWPLVVSMLRREAIATPRKTR